MTKPTVSVPLAQAGHLELKTPSRFVRAPAKMAMLLTTGILLMVSHHLFYQYLDMKPVHQGLAMTLTSQKVASVLGNLNAYVARTVLAAAVSIAFAQLLWSHLRAKDNSIEQIDALVSCEKSPFSLSSLPAWSASTLLLILVAIVATAMSVITLFASSALTIVSSDVAYLDRCTVGAPNLANGNLGSYRIETTPSGGKTFGHPISETVSYASRVIVQGSPLSPLSWCSATCQYPVKFTAPALNCTNTTNTADFNQVLPSSQNTFTVWNSSYVYDDANGLVINAALATLQKQAVRCQVFNATYSAFVSEQIDSTTLFSTTSIYLQSDKTKIHDPLNRTFNGSPTWLGLNSIGASLAEAVSGVAIRDLKTYGWTPNPNIMAFTWMVKLASIGADPGADLMVVLPSLMENITLSVASGYLDLAKYPSTVTSYNTTCYYASTLYSYNPQELLATYGGSIFFAAICLLFGWLAQRRRTPGAPDNSLDFSRFVAAVINQATVNPSQTPLLTDKENATINSSVDLDTTQTPVLTEKTRVTIEHGQFYVVE